MTTLATYPPPGTLGTDNPGGTGALVFLYGIPLAGAAIGAAAAGKGHRLVGGGIGLVGGILGMLGIAKLSSMSSQAAVGPDKLPPPSPITDLVAWQKTPFGVETDPNSPAFACSQATRERNAGIVGGPWANKCNAWRNQ